MTWEDEFLEWIDDIDGYYVENERIEEEWPEFYERYHLTGVTMSISDDGNMQTPVRDFRQTVKYGQAFD